MSDSCETILLPQAAKVAYERNLEPMERLVAEHLRVRLPHAQDTANALQSLNRLHDFREIIARPTIAREMSLPCGVSCLCDKVRPADSPHLP